ncbi:MAG: DUF2235 domain-containing protein [Pseudomonadota bacterium]
MKRIALFCDGTWNSAEMAHPTNVRQLSKMVTPEDAEGNRQVIGYFEGVGARETDNWFSRQIDKLGGGAFGWGLTENLKEAYTFLAENYDPGDEVYIFGFSRGAYTARSLAGLIRNCGIPGYDEMGSVPDAIELYRRRDDDSKPDDMPSLRFRADFSPRVATSETDKETRDNPGECVLYNTRYLGIWDTVGALGVPSHLTRLSSIFNRKYQFHDTDLSRSVFAARHAVAIDERRRTFIPTLWNNVDTLNSLSVETPARYEQLWFPGTHGTVGGGGPRRGISEATMYWVGVGARNQGLHFNDEFEARRESIDPSEFLDNKPGKPGLLTRLMALDSADRQNLKDPSDVAWLTRRRFHLSDLPDGAPYNPPTLSHVQSVLRQDGPPGDDKIDA